MAAARRAYWKGDLKLSLITCPIALYPASSSSQAEKTHFGAAGMTYEEAADIACCAVGTVKSRVNRARVRLVSLLGVEGTDEFGPDRAMGA
jgi:RNA polymerase sigma-70 factor (ECF subfamily)